MDITSIAAVIGPVKTAGAMALQEQRGVAIVERGYKDDGSVLTEVDRKVEDYLVGQISELYPQANLVTEESPQPFDPEKRFTFALDPIDGTDVFSLGMPGWCVSVGLLDGDLKPVAGALFAPRLDLLFVADVGQRAVCNGCAVVGPHAVDLHSSASSLMVSSRIHRWLDLGGYRGKARSIGSAALHLCFCLAYPTVDGSLQHRGACIWDLAGAHALLRSHGCDLVYFDGGAVDYGTLLDGSATLDELVAGSVSAIHGLRTIVTRRAHWPR